MSGSGYTVVWGASGGAGKALVSELIKQGKDVIAYARDKGDLTNLRKKNSKLLVREFTINEDFYHKEVLFLKNKGISVNGVVDCVGSTHVSPNSSLTERLDQTLTPNLYHQYLFSRTFDEVLLDRSSIVFISSIRAATGTDSEAIEYAFAKAAVENLTKSLAHMFSGREIRVNCIRPTPIDNTKMSDAWPQSVKTNLRSRSTYNKLLSPEELSDVAMFLLSNKSRSITGAIIDANSGFLLI